MNAGSVVGIPWSSGDTQTLPYTKEFIALKGDGDGKTLDMSGHAQAQGLTFAPTASTHAHEPPGETFTTQYFGNCTLKATGPLK